MSSKKHFAVGFWVWVMAILAVQASVHAALVIDKKLVSPASGQAGVGELVNFQITISNTSRTGSIVALTVEDTYTADMLQFLMAEPAPSSSVPAQGYMIWQDLTDTLGDLGPGQTFTISVTFRAIAPTIVAGASNTVTAFGTDDQQAPVSAGPVNSGLEIAQNCAADLYEPNDAINLGKSIGLNEAVTAYLCPQGDVDYYSLSLSTPGKYYIQFFSLPADYNLYLLNSQGQVIGQSENKGTESEAIQLDVTAAGRWSIQVAGQGFSYNLPYKLIVTKPNFGGADDSGGEVQAGEPLVLKVEGLPPGDPGLPNKAYLYFDIVDTTHLLKIVSILPNGRLDAGVRIPPNAKAGPHSVIGQIIGPDGVIDVMQSPVNVALAPGSMKLWVDDAWARDPAFDMPIVNKLVPEYSGSIGRTKVDVNCRFIPSATFSGTSVKFKIQVEGDKFAAPDAAYVRTGFGGPLTPISFVNEGGGAYSAVVTDGALENKHCIFRFRLPTSLAAPDTVDITAQTLNPSDNALLLKIVQPRQVRLSRGFSATIFLNRNTLFRDMDDAQVADLLAELHIHSQAEGLFGPHDKRAAIYCVDSYLSDTSLTNWNNMTVNYSSEFSANNVPRLIWLLMQEVLLQYSGPSPFYVMIVGNDEQFPFYRMNDPSNSEAGWATASGNPAMLATSNDFYFTDNFYGFFLDGSVDGYWFDGDMDLVIGRIIGDGAQDMKEFYLNGIMHNGDTGRSVMASVDGWELGYEPDDDRPGEVDDYLNVPGRLAARGFGVYNDGESPRTIDKMTPYPSNWSSGFKSAANAGMDLFFIGGHNGYDSAGLPGDGFDASDTPTKYTRFDDDNPIVMIVGCHGGLPVPNIGSWPGGAGTSMVYDVIRSGARAYYGASGFSYGSPGNLHGCLWGELLLQHNFGVFTQYLTGSTTLGFAVRQGKINFPFGVGSNNGLDQKTVTEFNLFGVPWQRLSYPGAGGSLAAAKSKDVLTQLKAKAAPGAVRERSLLLAPRQVSQLAANTYQQTFNFTMNSTTAGKLDGFDIIDIAGGDQQYVIGAPVLPGLTQHSIALPTGGQILGLTVDLLSTTTLGSYNIPTAAIEPWSVTGITLTTATTINYMYPAVPAETRESSQNHYMLTVFPVRHNPTTNQTVLNGNINVTVTYEAPVPYGILNFAPGIEMYAPGTLPTFSAEVFNMGSSGLSLNADLAIWNDDTNEGLTTQSLAMNLAPGAVYPLLASGTIPMDIGRYGARLRVWDSAGGPEAAAAAVTEFEVKEVVLSNLAAVYDALTGQVSLSVQAANLSDHDGVLALGFAISENGNLPLDVVSVTSVSLGGGEHVSIPGTWLVDGVTSGSCLVEAVATFDGVPTNSVQATFTAFTPQTLLDAILNHILGKKQLNQSDRKTADRNEDDVIDVGDVVRIVNETQPKQ